MIISKLKKNRYLRSQAVKLSLLSRYPSGHMQATVEPNSSSTTHRYSQPHPGFLTAGIMTTDPCPLLSPE